KLCTDHHRSMGDPAALVDTAVVDINVLVVEDHLALRKGLELLLRSAGLHVVGATASAQQGLQMFAARRPHVAVLDVNLGDGSGTELAAKILALDPRAGILVYTGLIDARAIEAAAACGARGF